jgi:hypothetical protein
MIVRHTISQVFRQIALPGLSDDYPIGDRRIRELLATAGDPAKWQKRQVALNRQFGPILHPAFSLKELRSSALPRQSAGSALMPGAAPGAEPSTAPQVWLP